ncbi:hypothetical protein ABKV19_000103 [Rosa sericea]
MQRELSCNYLGQPLQRKFEKAGLEDVPMVPIRVRFFKQFRSGSRFWNAYDTESIFIAEKTLNCNLHLIQSKMERFGLTVEEDLSVMGVPEDEQPAIIQKLLKVVEVAVPAVPISVLIVDVTVQISMGFVAPITVIIGDLLNVDIIDSDTWESLETRLHAHKFIPATKLSIEGLEKVKLYSLEAAVRNTQCAICKDDLDPVGVGEEGIDPDPDDQQLMITRLPCSHLFHRNCIVNWLGTSHLCPICRYPMETEQVSEAPEFSVDSHWLTLLIMSAGFVITVTVLCRLSKQS